MARRGRYGAEKRQKELKKKKKREEKAERKRLKKEGEEGDLEQEAGVDPDDEDETSKEEAPGEETADK